MSRTIFIFSQNWLKRIKSVSVRIYAGNTSAGECEDVYLCSSCLSMDDLKRINIFGKYNLTRNTHTIMQGLDERRRVGEGKTDKRGIGTHLHLYMPICIIVKSTRGMSVPEVILILIY